MRVSSGFSEALFLGALILSIFVYGIVEAGGKGMLKIGNPPPEVTLSDLNGNTITIPDAVKGKVVIIHFWAVWCSRCLEELAALQSLYADYKQNGLIIIAINQGQSKDEVRSFVNKVGISYSIFLDPDKKIGKEYGVSVLPRTFILERNGLIKYKIYGGATEDKLKKLVLNIL